MDTEVKIKPQTMAELLPQLAGLISQDSMKSVTHTATKEHRPTMANIHRTVVKPMSIAEMLPGLRALQSKTVPKNDVHENASAMKKWNSSCKIEKKTISHSSNGQMKHNSVRKVLNFQPQKPKPATNSRMTMMTAETPKFPKLLIKYKKPINYQARNTVRISGICNIPETPVVVNKPTKIRNTIANKENINRQPIIDKPQIISKPNLLKKVLVAKVPDSPLSSSSGDSSFLRNEQDIENSEKMKKNTNRIADASTPYTDNRNDKDYFNNTQENTYHDNTIMSFDSTVSKDNKMDESVIASLCNMLNKATVSSDSKELKNLLEVQIETENNIKMLEIALKNLAAIKDAQTKSLLNVKKLIQEKNSKKEPEVNVNVSCRVETPKKLPLCTDIQNNSQLIKTLTKSPSYKRPNKKSCLKKKDVHKSMPNIAFITPEKGMGERALSVYQHLKKHNNYLVTPKANRMPVDVLNTPARVSHNLKRQLDKIYGDS